MVEGSGDGGGGRGGGGRGGGRGRGRGGRGRSRGVGRGPTEGNQGRGDSGNKGRGNSNNAKSGNKEPNPKTGASGGGGGGNKNRRRNNNNNYSRGSKESNNKDPAPAKQLQLSPEEIQKQDDERKRTEQAEEERMRLEAKEKALEEARQARVKAKEELNTKVKETNDYLRAFADAASSHKKNRAELSPEALRESRRKFEANKKSLKSDLKKCTAFVKKVKSGTAWSMKPDDIVRDVSTLNLSRYVEEVVAAILEAKLKAADLPVVLALCKAMHERYPAFLSNLTPSLWAVISGKSPDETGKNRRIYVRIVTEFLLNGISSDTKSLVKLIAEVTGGKDGNYAVTDANVVVAFAKTAGFEIFGVTPAALTNHTNLIENEESKLEADEKEVADVSEEEKGNNDTVHASNNLVTEGKNMCKRVQDLLSERAVSEDVSKELRTHCKGAYKTLSTTLVSTHGKLQTMEKRCEQDRLLSGSLSESREKGLADARKLKDSLLRSVETLSDMLDLPMPKLKEEENEEEESGGVGLELWTKGGGEDGADFWPFDDEETKIFYCDIPDFLMTVPPALLGLNQDEIDKRKAENLTKFGSCFESVAEEGESEGAEVVGTSEAQLEADYQEESKETEENNEEATEQNKDTPHYKLMVLLEQELPECSRREQIDEIAEKFCTNHGSAKNARKRLTQTLFIVPRTRLDLLPYYSRLAATLGRVWSDISDSLVSSLEQQFHGQAKYKKNQNIESRLKTARFIGELTKFRLAPPMVVFRCIRRCLDDFTGGNVDVACCLLESCGRYLYRLKHTNEKLTTLMDAMMRLSKAKHLDERSQALINTAFYTVKPPPGGPKKKAKAYPPLEGYLRHLLMVRLQPSESSISFVSKQLIRLPWADASKQCGGLICRIMLKACRRGRYKSIHAVAWVAAKLRRHKPEVCIRLLDSVLEELQLAMEYPAFKDQQRTLTMARLLGELYCASLASGQLIIQQLYKFLNFGHEIPPALREASAKAAENTENSVIPNSAGATAQTIQEDEEMNDAGLEKPEEHKELEPIAVSKYSKYDPRVPNSLDSPNSVFRIKLVCTLLESVANTIVSRNNLSKLDGFLAAFQRYLFTKIVLPTEVEFSLLDTFDMIDSQWRKMLKETGRKKGGSECQTQGFPRYKTWLEAHNATVRVEEAEALAEERAQNRLEGLAAESKSVEGDGSVSSDLMNDDDEMMEEEDDDSTEDALSASGKDSINDDQSDQQLSGDETGGNEEDEDDERMDGEDDDDEDDEDSDDNEASDDDFDEEAYMQQLEAEAFERELRRLTMDALEKGKATSRGGKVADSMPMGSQVVRKKQGETAESIPSLALGGKSGISFQLLKKGNKGKMEAKEFYVPSDTNLAAVATKQDDQAAKERDMIKARVLQYEAESADAEVSGGNVYLEQEKLQVIRNRLSMDEIDRNFGTSGGNLRPNDKAKTGAPGARAPSAAGRSTHMGGRGYGGGRGRGGGRNSGGRSLV